ncbi:MAG: hypothetical protein F9K29_00105 [Hyphomicrobiaceae bacterium]|nr:MAG: hypothetical protein F9K29_00105 [Hyphomicrobiaceae bacterium]
MRVLLMAVLALATLGSGPRPAQAADREPQVYFFWAESCAYSQRARSFLQRAQAQDARIRIEAFEIERHPENLVLLGKVMARIGIPDASLVPLVIVGSNVILGFIDDDTTGKEILNDIAKCRSIGCVDRMRDLLGGPREMEQALVADLRTPTCVMRNAPTRAALP